ncbi:nucleotidyltransferase domain-containing protein [Polycladidibacter stylochi]|uniref:nucleotidyltransferase domain-containing protein n=1 Tax=Polycladidibacter stylochi TaxID=1807766 RepID=UPI0008325A7D|nr:nucleotidyltransferase domain-containing protein [Pseudovibrio stylochi]
MALKPFVPSIAPQMRGRIMEALAEIERQHDVTILLAIESGSRAWGFPSNDSDYDVRFVYVHRMDWYLSLEAKRDVIELPIDDELDISGWDLRKSFNLMLKSNPVLLEWLHSPIQYIWLEHVCESMMAIAKQASYNKACIYHYLKQGEIQRQRYLDGKDEINLKKYFYVLRPALALRWMRLLPGTTPPMNLQELVKPLDLSQELLATVEDLIAIKTQLGEAAVGAAIPALDQLIEHEFALAHSIASPPKPQGLRDEADMLFRQIVKSDWP